jgi:hypothetical protein
VTTVLHDTALEHERLTEDGVRGLAYTHRDADGYWQPLVAERQPYGAEAVRMRVTEDEAMVQAYLGRFRLRSRPRATAARGVKPLRLRQ